MNDRAYLDFAAAVLALGGCDRFTPECPAVPPPAPPVACPVCPERAAEPVPTSAAALPQTSCGVDLMQVQRTRGLLSKGDWQPVDERPVHQSTRDVATFRCCDVAPPPQARDRLLDGGGRATDDGIEIEVDGVPGPLQYRFDEQGRTAQVVLRSRRDAIETMRTWNYRFDCDAPGSAELLAVLRSSSAPVEDGSASSIAEHLGQLSDRVPEDPFGDCQPEGTAGWMCQLLIDGHWYSARVRRDGADWALVSDRIELTPDE